jgi:hypothetical protein
LIKDDIHRHIAGPIDEFKALMRVLVHDDGHAGNKHQYSRHRDGTVIALVHYHQSLILGRSAVFPLMLGQKYAHRHPALFLESQRCLHVQVPAVPVEGRDDGDA